MKTLTKLALTGALIFELNSCNKDDQKYENFANFVKKEGAFSKDIEKYILEFSANNKEYICYYDLYSSDEKILTVNIYNEKSIEHFQDRNLDGLDDYLFDNKDMLNDYSSSSPQSKKDKEKYEMLIDSIPKWYAESKKEARKLSPLEKFNQDNKKVYENFSKFLKNNPNKKKDDKNLYHIGEQIDFLEKNGKVNFLEVKIDKVTFSDDGLNGLDYIFKEKESGLIENIFFKDLSQEKQLHFAQEYAKNLIRIMGKTKEKRNYKYESKEESKEKPKEESQKKQITKEELDKIEKEIREEFTPKKGIQDEFNKQPK